MCSRRSHHERKVLAATNRVRSSARRTSPTSGLNTPVRNEGDSDMSIHLNIDQIPNVRRFENFPKEQMVATSMELTHAVYPHD